MAISLGYTLRNVTKRQVQDPVKPNISSQVLENPLVLGMVTRVHNNCIVCCFKLVTSIDSYAESAALEASLRHIRCLLFIVVLGPQRTHWLEQTGLPRNSCTRDRTQSTPAQPALATWHIRHIKSHMDESMRQFWGTTMCHVSPAVRQPSPVSAIIPPASYHGVLFVSLACKNLGTNQSSLPSHSM